MSFGYMGKKLNIDVGTRQYKVSDLSDMEKEKFIGGAGLNAWFLLNSISAGTDPLGPDNPLIFGTGPLVGLKFPTAARATCTSLSPLTGLFGDSNCGGVTGVGLKKTGFDHIIIKGRSEKPCILIVGGQDICTFKDASYLWGMDIDKTIQTLEKDYPGNTPLVIGPAAENKVLYATIHSKNGSNFSRTGMGTIMGAKNIKAIILAGKEKIKTHDPEGLEKESGLIINDIKKFGFPNLFKKYGTAFFLNMLVSKGLMYGDNWRRKLTRSDIKDIDVIRYLEKTDSKATACFRCPLSCRRKWAVAEGRYKGEHGHGFDVAHIMSLGLTLGLKDITHVLYVIKEANRLGLDINEMAGTIGMAIDAHKNGMIDKQYQYNRALDFGEIDPIIELIQSIAYQKGLGKVLSLGTKRAAEFIGNGAQNYALTMKGMHWPAHSAPPFVMGFSISTRGGDFLKAVPYLLLQSPSKKLLKILFKGTGKTKNFYSHADKGRAVWWHENYKMLVDCMGTCFYLSLVLIKYGDLFYKDFAKLYSLATGLDVTGLELLLASERTNQVERAINSIRGHLRKDDSFTKRPEPDSWGEGIDFKKQGMLDEYYEYRGLSHEGLLSKQRLDEIGLHELSKRLETENLLSENSTNPDMAFDDIAANPSGSEIKKSIKSKIVNKIEQTIMRKMVNDSNAFLKRFENSRN